MSMSNRSGRRCCTPARGAVAAQTGPAPAGWHGGAVAGMVTLEGGEFLMGTDDAEGSRRR
ncbi:hypothetical protein [Saccharopolyspora erythraea]|uniref:Uncharacterized protein n=1 Tax=Saccharopolyspora erythraea TaxID=1836 RepID=A0ABP3M2H8_SACER|nr:hypothetical protein [Saccharopolyspora erythraea]QRK87562.1 hypothetical protein JQX30_22565 [Saccharopolyspora erythraea]